MSDFAISELNEALLRRVSLSGFKSSFFPAAKQKESYFLQVGLNGKCHEYFCTEKTALRWFKYYANKYPSCYVELINTYGETIAFQD